MLRSLLLVAAALLIAAPGQAKTCSQFRTCAEAVQALKDGNTRLDRDGDGIPCETLCKGYRPPGGKSSAAPRPAAQPKTISAGPVTLVSVGDGDTIRVRARDGQTVTVRMACIDAPETAQGASGAASRQQLQRLVTSGRLELRPQATDRYGRTVAEVFASGRNVNLEMVRSGQAFAYRRYLGQCDGAAYLAAEAQAQARRAGVWALPGGGVRPWEFRAERRR